MKHHVPDMVAARSYASPLLIVLLTVLLTALVLLLLLAFVPGFDRVYTWMKPKSDKECIGISMSTKNATVKAIADATNEFLNTMVDSLCPYKHELLSIIDLLPSPPEHATQVTCSTHVAKMKADFDESPLGKNPKMKDAYSALFSAFTAAMCQDDHPDHDKTIAMMKAMVDAIC
jgi:hypothetical protein